ncbi:MAG: zinc-finger domain-containing protein [Rudaea sp.]
MSATATCAPIPASNAPGSTPANTESRYNVTRADLPLSCPMPGMRLWNSHPKVYLAIEATGHAQCPYCGAQYALIDSPLID